MHAEELYRFPYESPEAYDRPRDVHVLLSVDADQSPAIYPAAWAKTYGKGRIYYNSLGQVPETMMSKPIMGRMFAAIQFLADDLEPDTTPNPKK